MEGKTMEYVKVMMRLTNGMISHVLTTIDKTKPLRLENIIPYGLDVASVNITDVKNNHYY